jgi:GNAT superfamily N-acetyltransferase
MLATGESGVELGKSKIIGDVSLLPSRPFSDILIVQTDERPRISPVIEIRPTSGIAGLREFVRFPFDLYRQDRNWVPPLIADEVRSLDPAHNPVFEFCEAQYWLAYRDGQAVGRVATFLNRRDNERRSARIARFGYCDFIDDPAVSSALIRQVEQWARDRDMTVIEGPQGAGHFDRNGVLVEGFDTLPSAISAYNFPYYAGHLEACGLRKVVDYLEHHVDLDPARLPRLGRIAERVLETKNLHLWQAGSRKELVKRGREFFALINTAYVGLHDFVPLSPRQIDFLIGQFFTHIDPKFIKVVVDTNDRIVACAVAMTSFSKALQAARGKLWPLGWWRMLRALRKSEVLDLYLVAVAPEFRHAGLNAVLMHEMHRTANTAGLRGAETTGELETNHRVLAMWKAYDTRVIRRRRIYAKAVSA